MSDTQLVSRQKVHPIEDPAKRKQRLGERARDRSRRLRADPNTRAEEAARALARHHERKCEPEYAAKRKALKRRYDTSPEGAAKNKEQWESYYAKPEVRVTKSAQSKERNAKPTTKTRVLRRKLQDRYGLTLEQRDALLSEQEGKCGCCGRSIVFGDFNAHVDHCHVTGRVRGILCNKCNTGIGSLGDDIAGLERAIAYLMGSKSDVR